MKKGNTFLALIVCFLLGVSCYSFSIHPDGGKHKARKANAILTEKLDTITMIDPVTLQETIKIVKTVCPNPDLGKTKKQKTYTVLTEKLDTITMINPVTLQETIKIVTIYDTMIVKK